MSKCTRCTYINYQITRHEQNNLRTYFHHQKQFSDHLFVHWSLLHPARQSKIPQMFASSFWWNWFLPHHMWRCGDCVQQQECGDQQWLVQLSHFWEVSDIEMLRVRCTRWQLVASCRGGFTMPCQVSALTLALHITTKNMTLLQTLATTWNN